MRCGCEVWSGSSLPEGLWLTPLPLMLQRMRIATEPNVTSLSVYHIAEIATRNVRQLKFDPCKWLFVAGNATSSRHAVDRGESKIRQSYLGARTPDGCVYITSRGRMQSRISQIESTLLTLNTKT